MPFVRSDRPAISPIFTICLSGAVIVLLLLFGRLQSEVAAGCGRECVASMRQSLRDAARQNEMLRRELGRLRIEMSTLRNPTSEETNAKP